MTKRTAFLCLLFLASLRSAFAADQWVQVHSDHFTVLTDSGEKQGRHIVDQFERMRWVYHTLFPKNNVDPALPIIILAAKNEKSFQALEPSFALAKGQLNISGLFLKTSDKYYMLLRLGVEGEHPFATIYHEYTHLQFSAGSEWMPLWLFEGLAEFMQNTDIHDKDAQIGQPSFNNILYLRQNHLIPLTTLFKVDHNSPYYHEDRKGSIFYAESWALTHYLEITGRKTKVDLVGNYLTLVSHHEDPVVAAQKAFGDLKELELALGTYIRESYYQYFILSSAAAPLNEASYKVQVFTETESDAARANFLAYIGRKPDARSLIDTVIKADPNNALAHETLGYIAFREGDRVAARKYYGDAVRLDSQSYLAHYYFALTSFQADVEGQDEAIESSLRAAIKINPTFAPAYDELATFYGARHTHLDEAHTLNLYALQLDPRNLRYRMNAANLLMTAGRMADAAAVLRTALKVAETPEQTANVQSRLTQIEMMQSSQHFAATLPDAQPSGDFQLDGTQKVTTSASQDNSGPKHPTELTGGPVLSAEGVIRGVHCSDRTVIEFKLETATSTLSLHNNDYYKLELSASGFTPSGDISPCHDLEGMKGKVEYTKSSDKTDDGQVSLIELRK